ncbi:hypothetical protein LLEC1_00755 [Akanthomyces lecanii]|uniref:C2H2-type domain-containing protein n=1 Tax=Cordyceps confragosa TaxID=2714763 RepID=A0A179I891_CORDF|nr:hypothetical protein LLEC1_00755 [Akanthomyces lecanii]
MARGYSPPESPLSSVRSSDHSDDDGHDFDDAASRPSKRLKVDAASRASRASSTAVHDVEQDQDIPEPDPLEGMSDLSSDTSRDIPSSPINARLDEEDFQDQVSVCDWDGCEAGDQGNMDRLVEHIHNSHIENRQKKYTCEWKSCSRKGLPHASGYALKAHMRSHTREKPFYCYLPECDRSFTRSDALAKHMRTSGPPGGKSSKLKIIIKTPQSHSGHGVGEDGADESGHGEDGNADYFTALTSEIFTADELAFSVDKLYRKCFWEAKWADEVGETLRRECREWEDVYYKEWLEKETLLSQVIQSEVDWHERRKAILTGAADVQVSHGTTVAAPTEAAAPVLDSGEKPADQENGLVADQAERSPISKPEAIAA